MDRIGVRTLQPALREWRGQEVKVGVFGWGQGTEDSCSTGGVEVGTLWRQTPIVKSVTIVFVN